jgi:excisionase family DNA binding protein
MEKALPSTITEDAQEAVETLERAVKIVAKIIVKAVMQELLSQGRVSGSYGNMIATFSMNDRESNDQKKSLVFSVAEAAELLSISRGTAYTLVQTGQLPCIKYGRRMLIPKHALMKMLDEVGTVKPM